MENIGWASLEVIPSLKGFEGKVNAGTSGALDRAGTSGGERFGTGFAHKASHSIHEKFKESAKFIIGPLVGAFALEKGVEFAKDAISGAEDLAKSQNRLNLVFGDSAERIDKFGERAAKTYGLSDLAARKAASSIGILGRQAGLSDSKNAEFSVRFSKMATDLASFNNVDPSVTLSALTRGLAGATRGLKPFGILIDSAQQKAEALRLGLLKPVKDSAKIHSAQIAVLNDQKAYNDAIDKHGKSSLIAETAQAKLGVAQKTLQTAVEGTLPPLTAQQKVLANASLITQQAKVAQGDFGKSSHDLANQQKILSASIDNAKDRLGKGLLPIATDFVEFINHKGLPVIDKFSRWFEKDGADGIQHFADSARPLANSVLPAVGTGFKDIAGFLHDAAGPAKSVFDAFNSLPDFAKKAIVLGGAAGYVAKKSGLLSFGAKAFGSGGLGSIASLAKPLPVFVVNEGFGGAGGVGGAAAAGEKGLAARVLGKLAPGAALAGLSGGAAAAAATAGVGVGLAAVKGFQLSHTNPLFEGTFGGGKVPSGLVGIFGNKGSSAPSADPGANESALRTLLHVPQLTGKVDTLNAGLSKTSQGLDTIGRDGTKNYDLLARRTADYAARLKDINRPIHTKVDLDTRDAEAKITQLRAHAGRHISASLSIELAGNSPQQRALDGVRR